jgi:hypothetical protein
VEEASTTRDLAGDLLTAVGAELGGDRESWVTAVMGQVRETPFAFGGGDLSFHRGDVSFRVLFLTWTTLPDLQSFFDFTPLDKAFEARATCPTALASGALLSTRASCS